MRACKTGVISNVEQGMMNYKVNEECARYFNFHDSLPAGLLPGAKA